MARMEIAARFQYANECRLAVKGSGAFFSLFFFASRSGNAVSERGLRL